MRKSSQNYFIKTLDVHLFRTYESLTLRYLSNLFVPVVQLVQRDDQTSQSLQSCRGGQILILLSPMARRPRVFAPALPCYRARQSTTKTFRGDDDYKAYLDRLESATRVSRALSCFIPA